MNIIPLRLFQLFLLTLGAAGLCVAQEESGSEPEPASTNIVGQEYPKVDGDRRALFRVRAPEARRVRVSLGNTELTQGDDGFWTGTTEPLDPGFHYYTLNIDGVSVADPSSESFFGGGSMRSGIEVPEEGVDFYDIKDVPHGEIRTKWYYSQVTGEMRQAYVYTPPGYDEARDTRYSVLYLQHGMGEDRRAWPNQGRANLILDNLIAEGKAEPMIVVMDDGGIAEGFSSDPPRRRRNRDQDNQQNNLGFGNGNNPAQGARGRGNAETAAAQGDGRPGNIENIAIQNAQGQDDNNADAVTRGNRGRGNGQNAAARGRGNIAAFGGRSGGGAFWDGFASVLVEDIIPMIDSTYRTIPDREHRAMAGLSLGGTQTYQITEANLDKFANIGIFSAPFGFPGVETGYNGLLATPEAFAKQVDVFYISMGSKEGSRTGRSIHEELEAAGVEHVYYEAPGTGHEFQTWRKSLHGFAQLLFQE